MDDQGNILWMTRVTSYDRMGEVGMYVNARAGVASLRIAALRITVGLEAHQRWTRHTECVCACKTHLFSPGYFPRWFVQLKNLCVHALWRRCCSVADCSLTHYRRAGGSASLRLPGGGCVRVCTKVVLHLSIQVLSLLLYRIFGRTEHVMCVACMM